MSGASYRRGSAVISRQACADSGCPGCCRCRSPVVSPRPDGWGKLAAERATDHARRVLSGSRRYGLPDPSLDVLAATVRERARVGLETAKNAARTALEEKCTF